jgi:hypothetical protein
MQGNSFDPRGIPHYQPPPGGVWPQQPHVLAYTARPGVVTAVSVFSIILASVGILVNLGGLVYAMQFQKFSSRVTVPAPPAVVTPPPAPVAAPSEYIAPDGLSAHDRRIVIEGLSQVQPLSDARRQQIDALLADAGVYVIHLSGDSLTPDRVAANVSGVKQLPDSNGGEPQDVFILGTGRLQVSDRTAVFFKNGEISGIRTKGGSFNGHIGSGQINAIVEQVQSLCNHAMDDAQVQALAGQLQSGDQKLITPTASVAEAVQQVQSAQVLPDGTVAITTQTDTVSFGPKGEVFPGITQASVFSQPKILPLNIARRDTTLMNLDCLLGLLISAFLLTIGIMLTRNSALARKLHLGYAVFKLLLVALTCYSWYMVWNEVINNPNNPQPDPNAPFAVMCIFGLPGAIYPIILLIVLNLRSVRQFFAAPVVR